MAISNYLLGWRKTESLSVLMVPGKTSSSSNLRCASAWMMQNWWLAASIASWQVSSWSFHWNTHLKAEISNVLLPQTWNRNVLSLKKTTSKVFKPVEMFNCISHWSAVTFIKYRGRDINVRQIKSISLRTCCLCPQMITSTNPYGWLF